MSRAFDRFMVEATIGTNRKLRRLPVSHRWAYVAGVLALAAQSPLRGALLITDGVPATEFDVAEEATINVKDARAALAALRNLGMLERDSDGVEWVHDWDKFNPDPKPSDGPTATRERKRKQRERQRGHAGQPRDTGVTEATCHAPEVEVEVEELPPLTPPPGGKRGRERERWERDTLTWLASTGVSGPPSAMLRIVNEVEPWAQPEPTAAVRDFALSFFSGTVEVAA